MIVPKGYLGFPWKRGTWTKGMQASLHVTSEFEISLYVESVGLLSVL